MTDEAPNQLRSMSDEEAAEWSCRELIQSLLRPHDDETPNVSAALDYARRTLEAGAEGLLRRAVAIEDADDRIDALGDIEFLVEGVLRINAERLEAATESGSMEQPAPKAEETPVIGEAMKRRAGRPLGPRAPVIAALRQLYPAGDPVVAEGMHREVLRKHIAQKLGLTVDKIDPKTLDRARTDAWLNVHI